VETRAVKGIFISYRRQDEPNFAGRLYDRLAERFGDDRVFIDIDSIDLGLDFTDVIDQSLARCKVMLVVIGRGWLEATDADGEPRLENPDDFVRLEIEKAMSRRDVRVIPIVVEGAVVPRSAKLPSTLAPLARRNGIEMSHARFAGDTERLIKTIERVIGETNDGA
jgi:TIR domain